MNLIIRLATNKALNSELICLATNKALNPEVVSLNIGMAANGTVCIHSRIDYGYWLKAHESPYILCSGVSRISLRDHQQIAGYGGNWQSNRKARPTRCNMYDRKRSVFPKFR